MAYTCVNCRRSAGTISLSLCIPICGVSTSSCRKVRCLLPFDRKGECESRPLPITMCRPLPISLKLLPFYLTLLPLSLNSYIFDKPRKLGYTLAQTFACRVAPLSWIRLERRKRGLLGAKQGLWGPVSPFFSVAKPEWDRFQVHVHPQTGLSWPNILIQQSFRQGNT